MFGQPVAGLFFRRLFASGLLLILWMLILTTGSAVAHGDGELAYLSYHPVGANYLHLWISPAVPRVGEVHVKVLLTDAEFLPVEKQQVSVQITPLWDDGKPMRALAEATDTDNNRLFANLRAPARQEAVFFIGDPGDYEFEIIVTDMNGQGGQATFELEVLADSGWRRVALLGALTLLALGGSWLLVEGVGLILRFRKRANVSSDLTFNLLL